MQASLNIGFNQLPEAKFHAPMGLRNDVNTGQHEQDNNKGACKAHYTFRSHNLSAPPGIGVLAGAQLLQHLIGQGLDIHLLAIAAGHPAAR